MSGIQERTVSLPQEHAAFIDTLIASGAYGSASEVVRAGLRALQERDIAVERWPRESVAKTYDEMAANPSATVSAETVNRERLARHIERNAQKK